MNKYLWPIPQGYSYRTTQGFGEKLLDYTKICTTYLGQPLCLLAHDGIDLAVLRGTPIVAPCGGIITEAVSGTVPGAGGYGNQVRLKQKTEFGWREWVFAHALSLAVKAGDEVIAGQLLMLADNTGMSTGDHLHFGTRDRNENYEVINYTNGYFGYYNPLELFEQVSSEQLPVDMRYGQNYSYARELSWRLIHEIYAKKKAAQAGFKYDDRFMKAHVYGYWPGNGEDSVYNTAYFALWSNMTYPGYLKIKGLPGGKNLTSIG